MMVLPHVSSAKKTQLSCIAPQMREQPTRYSKVAYGLRSPADKCQPKSITARRDPSAVPGFRVASQVERSWRGASGCRARIPADVGRSFLAKAEPAERRSIRSSPPGRAAGRKKLIGRQQIRLGLQGQHRLTAGHPWQVFFACSFQLSTMVEL